MAETKGRGREGACAKMKFASIENYISSFTKNVNICMKHKKRTHRRIYFLKFIRFHFNILKRFIS